MDMFPSGIGRYEFLDRLREFEEKSCLPIAGRNYFNEGPKLISSATIPWGDEVRHLVDETYARFMHAKTWFTGYGLFEMESEIVEWTGRHLHHSGPVGVITSGGTESNLSGLVAAKANAGRGGSVVFPSYTHYSIPKGCRLFGLEPVPVSPTEGYAHVTADEISAAIRDDTIAIVATAGSFPFGAIDSIAEIGGFAAERGIHLHVDSCVGGYLLPFLALSGSTPRCRHGTSVSKGCARFRRIFTRTASLRRQPARFCSVIKSSTRQRALFRRRMACSRDAHGLGIAASWAMMTLVGDTGYAALAVKCMELRDRVLAGIGAIAGVEIFPGSRVNLGVIYSDEYNLYPVWLELRRRGWMLPMKNEPPPTSIVVWTFPQNEETIDALLDDFADAMTLATPASDVAENQVSGFDAYGDLSQLRAEQAVR